MRRAHPDQKFSSPTVPSEAVDPSAFSHFSINVSFAQRALWKNEERLNPLPRTTLDEKTEEKATFLFYNIYMVLMWFVW